MIQEKIKNRKNKLSDNISTHHLTVLTKNDILCLKDQKSKKYALAYGKVGII